MNIFKKVIFRMLLVGVTLHNGPMVWRIGRPMETG